jgi:hypothetical protein
VGSNESTTTSAERVLSGGRNALLALFLLADFALVLAILFTDKNLQNDFGAPNPMPALIAGYYVHWWLLLGEGLVDLAVALGVIALAVVPAMRGTLGGRRRWVPLGALLWSVVAIGANVGIVTSWKSVGFQSQSQFAGYLFDTQSFPGLEPYIPWLYDALLGAYAVTAIVGIVAVLRVRGPASPNPPS